MTNLTGSNLNNGFAVDPKDEGRDSPSTYPAYSEYKDSGVEGYSNPLGNKTVEVCFIHQFGCVKRNN